MPDDTLTAQVEALLRRQLPHVTAETVIGPDDPLAAYGLDSLGMVQLVVQLEGACSVMLPDEVLVPETFATIGSIVTVVENLTSAAGSGH